MFLISLLFMTLQTALAFALIFLWLCFILCSKAGPFNILEVEDQVCDTEVILSASPSSAWDSVFLVFDIFQNHIHILLGTNKQQNENIITKIDKQYINWYSQLVTINHHVFGKIFVGSGIRSKDHERPYQGSFPNKLWLLMQDKFKINK